jgi:hypothetical protein
VVEVPWAVPLRSMMDKCRAASRYLVRGFIA